MPSINRTKRARPEGPPFFVRLAVWGISALVLLSLLAVLALHLPSIQQEIILRAVGQIEAATNYGVQIESYNWWPFSHLYLTNVKVQAEGKQILSCEKIRLDYRLSVSRPFIIPDEVYLEKPFLQLERSVDGKWQIPVPSSPGGKKAEGREGDKGSFWNDFKLPRIRVNSGSITASQGGTTILSVKNISGGIRLETLSGPDGPRIRVDFEKLAAEAESSGLGKWRVEGSAAFDDREITVRNIVLSGRDECRIEIEGRWDSLDFENGKAKLLLSNFSARAIPELSPSFVWLTDLSGQIAVTREREKWSIYHDITSSDRGSLKGSLKIEQAPAGTILTRLESHFSDLKIEGVPYLPAAKLNGRIELEGNLDQGNLTKAQFSTSLDSSSIGGETLQKCDLTGNYEHYVLTLKSTSVKSSLADLKLSAVADLRGFRDPKHKGTIKAELSLEKGNLEKINPKLQQRLGGVVSIEAQHDPGSFREIAGWHAKSDVNLNIPDFITLKAAGSFQKELLKADYELDCKEVQRFSILYPQWLGKGRVVSRGTVSGKLTELSWDGEITWPRLQYSSIQAEQLSIKGKGRLTGKEENRTVSVKTQNLVFDGKKVSSLHLDLVQQKSSVSFQLKGDGIVNQLSARLSGLVERIWDFPLLSISTQGQIGWKDQSGSIEAKFDLEKEGIRIHSASLQQGKQKAILSGGVISESRTDLRASIESINAGQIIKALGLKDAFSGTVSGQVQVSGKPDNPEIRMNVHGNNCVIDGKQKIESLQLQGSYSKDTFVLQGEAKAEALPDPLAISARIPLRLSLNPPKFDLRQSEQFSSDIKIGALNASALVPFLDFLSKAGGQLQGEIHCSGTLKQPVVSGAGTWKNGFFQEMNWPHIADNIQAEWRADAKNLYVTKAEVSHLGGKVSVTGYIDWPRFSTLNYKAQATDLQVHDIYGIEGQVSGNAEVKDSPQAAELTGTLVFSKAKMSLGQLETNIAQSIQVIEADSKGDLLVLKDAKSPSKFYNRLKMDVGLKLPPTGTWVTGKGLKAEITGGLKLEKSPSGSIRLAGELQALRGTYSFQGKEMKIVEGSLVFMGTPEPDPQLRMLCQKQVKDVILQAMVSGPLSRPKLALSSMPAMNQVDILSYLMFDHPALDLNRSQSFQLQDRAASWLGSETSNIIKSVFGNNPLAPDTVGYRSSSSGKIDQGFANNPSTTTTTKETGIVEIGKHITPDLTVTYGRGIKGEEGNEVQIEYRINQRMSIQTQVGGAEQSGVDIFWRHDFGK
ncbi:MAG: translocation/assembly module TamB domain-containing protein [Syntrophobacteraceae bacterium]